MGSSSQPPTSRKPQQHHHGIPAVPLAKRSASAELSRPVVYINCDFNPSIELPFGEEIMAANMKDIRQRRKNSEATMKLTRWFLWALATLVILVSVWYLASIALGKDFGLGLTRYSFTLPSKPSSPKLDDDLYQSLEQ